MKTSIATVNHDLAGDYLPAHSAEFSDSHSELSRNSSCRRASYPIEFWENESSWWTPRTTESDVTGEQSHWWILYTRTRHEKSLGERLYAKRVPFYLPLIPKTTRRGGSSISSWIPLFPNYVFMFGSGEARLDALKTNRVSRVLDVPDGELLSNNLRQIARLIAVGAPLTAESQLEPGRAVRVKKGPFAGLEGIIVTRRSKSRLIVKVDYLLQGASVEIEDYMCEPL